MEEMFFCNKFEIKEMKFELVCLKDIMSCIDIVIGVIFFVLVRL